MSIKCFSRNSPSHKWEISNDNRHGSVLALEMFDMTADGVPDVLIGRDDGVVEVYGFDEMEEPVQRYSQVGLDLLSLVRVVII